MIHFYELASMDSTQRARLLGRAQIQIDELIEYVPPIVQNVRERGDEALLEFTARFNHVQLTGDRLRADRDEIERAYQVLNTSVHEPSKRALRNVRTIHKQQMPHERWFTQVASGVMAGEKITPISSVGPDVLRGKGAFPSVMYMLATPARIAGVPAKKHRFPKHPSRLIAFLPLLCGLGDFTRHRELNWRFLRVK